MQEQFQFNRSFQDEGNSSWIQLKEHITHNLEKEF